MLSLTAVMQPSPLEARRGVVRLHPEVLTALGLAHGDPVLLEGGRTTGARAARALPGTPPDVLVLDDLVLGNLRLRDGAAVVVRPADAREARRVVLHGDAHVTAAVDPSLLRSVLHSKVVMAGDQVSLLPQELSAAGSALSGTVRRRIGALTQSALLSVVDVEPPGAVVVGPGSVVGWQGGSSTTGSAPAAPARAPRSVPPAPAEPEPALRVADLPGLEGPAGQLREWLDLGFHHPDLLERLGGSARTGVLVTGAAGTGKASLVRAVAGEVGAALVHRWAPELASYEVDAAARELRTLLQAPTRPTVVLLEDVDALAPRDGGGPLATAFTAALRQALGAGQLAVVCTTSRPEALDPALLAADLLDHELAVPLPDRPQRRRVLARLTEPLPLGDDVDLDDVAARTPGFVPADLVALVREAGLRAAARQREADAPTVAGADLVAALDVVRPSSLDSAPLQLGGLTLEDVGDMAEVKAALTEAVLWPLQYPETFSRLGVSAPRGVLLYGPPGCGKTFLVKALAGTGQANVLSVKGAELLSKWVGESEAAVRQLFRRAREAAPSLVFLDEVDALAPPRGGSTDGGTSDRVVAALLTEMDGVEGLHDVVVVGATNRPDLIDPALLRPGRLERLVFVPPPDAAARAAVLRAAAKDVPLGTPEEPVDLEEVGERTEGFSAADCAALVREAALTAMRESMEATAVTRAHLEAALQVVRPSLDPVQVADLASYAQRREGR